LVVRVENNPGPQALTQVVTRLDQTPGISGASAPAAWRKGNTALVEAIPSEDGAAKPVRHTISNLQDDVLPSLQNQIGGDAQLTLGGGAPAGPDLVHALYGEFPYGVAFAVLPALGLLMRRFPPLVL